MDVRVQTIHVKEKVQILTLLLLHEKSLHKETTSGITTTSTSTTSMTTTTTAVTTTTTAIAKNKTVLVLNSYDNGDKWWKPAVLLDSAGRQDELGCFLPDQNTESGCSCSVTWENQLFVFGGCTKKRQISKLVGYNLKAIGSLPFDHWWATCTNMANKKLFLCFNDNSYDTRKCRWTDEPLGDFQQVSLSKYDHQRGSRISSMAGKFSTRSLISKTYFRRVSCSR